MATEQEGGRLFDQGMYGCIFTDRLRCKDGKGVGQGHGERPLTKILSVEDAMQEIRISDAIRKIPQWGQYFAVADAMCEPAEKQVEKELDQCGIIQDAPMSEFRILSMTYRGVPLHRYAFPLRKGFDFGRFAQHMVEGGAMLALFGIVHRDLHRGNVLMDGHMVPRIIDVNLSVFSTNVKVPGDIKHGHSFSITQEPPDSVLVNAVALGYKAPKMIEGLIEKKTTLKTISTVLGVSLAQMEEDIRAFHAKSKSMLSGDLVGWFRAYWPKIDSWAVGVALVEVIQRLSVWPEFVWNRERWRPVLRAMCEVDPMKRIDCVEALKRLDPGNVILRKYASRWRGAGYTDGGVEDAL